MNCDIRRFEKIHGNKTIYEWVSSTQCSTFRYTARNFSVYTEWICVCVYLFSKFPPHTIPRTIRDFIYKYRNNGHKLSTNIRMKWREKDADHKEPDFDNTSANKRRTRSDIQEHDALSHHR